MAVPTEEITINVDPESAKAYRTATDADRKKLDLLLSLRIRDAFRSRGSLKELMNELGRKAEERGLTPEILESIVNER